MASLTAVVVIAVLAGTLIPVLDDATETERTFKNTGLINLVEIGDDFSTTIVWDYTNPTKLTVDGETIDMPTNTPYQITAMFSDDWLLRINPGSNGGADVMVVDAANTSIYVGASVAASTSMTVTVASDTATFSNGVTTKTKAIDGGLAITAGDDYTYVLKSSTDTASVLGNSVVYGAGRSTVIGAGFNAIFSGTIDDGITAVYAPNTWTVGDITLNYDENNTYVNLYELSSFNAAVSNGDSTGTVTYSQFFVPYEVTADRAVQFTAGENAILNSIPIIVIVALLLAIIAMVLRSRME